MWYKGVYTRWGAYYRSRTGREPFDRLSILRYLKEEPYYVDDRAHRLGGVVRKCMALDLANAPDSVVEIAELIHQIGEARQVTTPPQQGMLTGT